MEIPTDAVLLRIYASETDRCDGGLLHEKIVNRAHALGIAGATVLHGIMGYGASSRVHTSKILRLSEDLPVVIEIVDAEHKLQPILAFLSEHAADALVTMENVRIVSGGDRQ